MYRSIFVLYSLASIFGIALLLAPSIGNAATLMYVTSGSGDRVTIYNTDNGNTEVGTVTVGDTPIGIVINGAKAYVANTNSDTVSVIDVTNNQVVGTIAVGDTPHSLAISGTGVYVTNVMGNSVSVIDTTNDQVVTTIAVGGGPRNIAISGTGTYVANFADNTVSVIDITSNQVVNTVALANQPHGVGINGTGAYVTRLGGSSVSIIDTTTHQVVATFAVGSQPEGIAFYGTGAYVTNYGGSSVTVVDTTNNQLVTTIATVAGPTFVRVNGTGAYVTNYLGNRVSVIDVTTNTIVETITTTQPFDIAFYDDITTLDPTLTAPTTDSSVRVCDDLSVNYTLPETPLTDSVQLQFLNTLTHNSVYAVLNSSTGATLNLENLASSPQVVSTTGGNNIAIGSYIVYLQYQDQFGNGVKNDTANLTIDTCVSSPVLEDEESNSGSGGGGGGVRKSTLERRMNVPASETITINSSSSSSSSSASTSTTSCMAEVQAFTDAPENAWYMPYVRNVVQLGIFKGYDNEQGESNGTFGPNQPILLAQVAKVGVQLNDEIEAPHSLENEPWYVGYMQAAKQNKFSVFGELRHDHEATAATPATRAQVIQTIMEALTIPISAELPPELPYTDLDTEDQHTIAILEATKLGIVSGDDLVADSSADRTFRPNDPINRAEVAKMVSLALQYSKDVSCEDLSNASHYSASRE